MKPVTLKEFLADKCSDWEEDGGRGRYTDPYTLIFQWARSPRHGGLPVESARPFANWLSNVWADWCEEPEVSVAEILDGAVVQWCGGRTEPS